MKKIIIIGKGRIGKAIAYFFRKQTPYRVFFLSREKEIKKADLLIGALPGEIGEKSWRLAIKYKKNLIDVSDLDPTDYLPFKNKVEKRKILIVPEAGFSPGLTNLICGYEANRNKVEEIEILAGTISKKTFFFPFLWSFEDLIQSHRLPVFVIKNRRKKRLKPFSGYREEKIRGIQTESYLGPGLGSLSLNIKVKNLSYRILRTYGFYHFFSFLKNHGFLNKKNINLVQKILEAKKQDNLSLARVSFVFKKNKKVIWEIKSQSKKREKFSSIQKLSSVLPVILGELILENKINNQGVLFLEKLGKDKHIFQDIIKRLSKFKIVKIIKTELS